MKKQTLLKTVILFLVISVFLASMVIGSCMDPRRMSEDVRVHDVITVNAGVDRLSADRFLVTDHPEAHKAMFVGPLDHVDLNEPGDYEVEIDVDGSVHAATLRVEAPAMQTMPTSVVTTTYAAEMDHTPFEEDLDDDMMLYADVPYGYALNAQQRWDELHPTTTAAPATTTKAKAKTTKRTTKQRQRVQVTPYSPRGSAGNATLDKLCDPILRRIINNSMSTYEISKQVYKFVRAFPYSAGQSIHYAKGAEYGLRNRRGNCYTKAYTVVALLKRAGVNAYYQHEYKERHAWAMVGNKLIDANNGRFWRDPADLQYVVSVGGFYLYRTGPAPLPSGRKYTFKLVYRNEHKIPYETIYELNPDEDSPYRAGQFTVHREGVTGIIGELWQEAYLNGKRAKWRDYMIHNDKEKVAKVDEILWVGRRRVIDKKTVPASKGTSTVETRDASKDGQRVPNTGKDGTIEVFELLLEVNAKTGEARRWSGAKERTLVTAEPYAVYRYVPRETPPPTTPKATEPPPTEPPTTEPPTTTPAPTDPPEVSDPTTPPNGRSDDAHA